MVRLLAFAASALLFAAGALGQSGVTDFTVTIDSTNICVGSSVLISWSGNVGVVDIYALIPGDSNLIKLGAIGSSFEWTVNTESGNPAVIRMYDTTGNQAYSQQFAIGQQGSCAPPTTAAPTATDDAPPSCAVETN